MKKTFVTVYHTSEDPSFLQIQNVEESFDYEINIAIGAGFINVHCSTNVMAVHFIAKQVAKILNLAVTEYL